MATSKPCCLFQIVLSILRQHGTAAVAVGPPAAPAGAAAAAAGTKATCSLQLVGHGNRPGLKKASLSCSGGTITAAADPQLLQALGSSSSNIKGVVWSSQ